MKPEIKTKLIARLLTGQDKQVYDRLHTRNGFCILGVLCDIYLQEIGQEWRWSLQGWASIDLSSSQPPTEVKRWAGLNDVQTDRLMTLNDKNRLSFPAMVDVLMKNPLFDEPNAA